MRPLLLIALTLLALPLLAADDDDDDDRKRPDERPEIAALLEDLAERVSKSNRADPAERAAVQAIDALGAQYARSGERDRAAIVRGLDRVFLANRRADRDGQRATPIFKAAAKALGKTGDEGAGRLKRWIGHAKHKRDLPLQRELILALGRTRSDDAVDELEDLLNEDAPELLAAAATALGNFDRKDQKVRKRLFESMLKALESAEQNARSNNSTASSLWRAVRGPGFQTLSRLTGERRNGTVSWRSWWNENKRRKWD